MALTDNLIAYYKMDEASGNAIDAHGSNDLTDNNTVAATTGLINGGRDFEAANGEYFSHASNADLQTGDIDFTITCWVKFESLAGSQVNLIGSKDGDSSNREWLFGWNGFTTELFASVFQGGTTERKATVTVPGTGDWHFLAFWHDATANTVNFQIDNGTPGSTATAGALGSAGTAPFEIGARSSSGPFTFDGAIDEFGFWKRVLTSDERTELFNSGAGLSYDSFGGGGGGGSALLLRLMTEGAFL